MKRLITKIISSFLAVAFLTEPLFGYDMETKLSELKIPFVKPEKSSPFIIVTMGGTKVAVMKEGVRNQDNKVVRAVMFILEPIIPSDAQVQEVIKANKGKTLATGFWCAEDAGLGNDSVIFYYEIDIPEDASDKQLTEAIINCSKIVPPFNFNYASQYKAVITKVLELDYKAGKAGSVEEAVRLMNQIDLSMCPADFAEAYRSHRRAWEKSLDKSGMDLGIAIGAAAGAGENRDNLAGAIILGLIGGIVGGGIQASAQQDDIKATWDKVKQIARKYGVKPPQE